MKLYVSVTDELTNVCHGYAEVTLSSAVPERLFGETRGQQLFRIVNSVKNISNSNRTDFILISHGYFTRFYIENGQAVVVHGGQEKYMDYRII